MSCSRIRNAWNRWSYRIVFTLSATFVSCTVHSSSEQPDKKLLPTSSPVFATVANSQITQKEVEQAAESSLNQLQLSYERDRHKILEDTLNDLIEERVLKAEAATRGIPQQQLIANEMSGQIQPVSDQDVDAYYLRYKDQIKTPKQQAAESIKQYLSQTRYNAAHSKLIKQLKDSQPVEILLEPLRANVTANGPAKGFTDAPITIIEFSDFQCPYCSKFTATLNEIEKNYDGKVRIVFRHFPFTSIHPQAEKAAEAALCANDQGRFWEMHDNLFANQNKLEVSNLRETATKLGLDSKTFNQCLDSGEKAAVIKLDVTEGTQLGITGTPGVFINGRFINGAVPYESVAQIIEEELKIKANIKPAKL